jgi:HAD superfamily hydrolase (TIGR01509 family)
LYEEKLAVFRRDLAAISGAKEFVASVSVPRAVASSSTVQALVEKLRLTHLLDLFEPNVFSSEMVARGKPYPDLFLHAARCMECEASACIVLEDSEHGVRAGVAAGMKVWGFTGGGHADSQLAHRLKLAGATEVFESYDAIQFAYSRAGQTA